VKSVQPVEGGDTARMRVEYMGFTNVDTNREYRLRAQDAGVFHEFVRAISLEAFTAHRARYQDAPEICFLKLQRELVECDGTWPDAYVGITDAELEEYRAAHAPKPPRRRAKTPPLT
jgi:hypothetical protein